MNCIKSFKTVLIISFLTDFTSVENGNNLRWYWTPCNTVTSLIGYMITTTHSKTKTYPKKSNFHCLFQKEVLHTMEVSHSPLSNVHSDFICFLIIFFISTGS